MSAPLESLPLNSQRVKRLVVELSNAIKHLESRGPHGKLDLVQMQIVEEKARELAATCKRAAPRGPEDMYGLLCEVSMRAGVTPHELDARFTRREVIEVQTTALLDDVLPHSLEQLLGRVPPKWLSDESSKGCRLGRDYLAQPIELLGSHRVNPNTRAKPQRYALALCACADHLNKVDTLDFWSLPILAAEVASLGGRLDGLKELGPHALEKFAMLPKMGDGDVASTIYELLVGLACLDYGLAPVMLAPERHSKTPDYRLDGLVVPTLLECKRRRSLLQCNVEDVHHARGLYSSVRDELRKRGCHVRIELSAAVELSEVPIAEFRQTVLSQVAEGGLEDTDVTHSWGTLATRTLPYTSNLSRTRLYSPSFLQEVFGWSDDEGGWDGLVAEVDPPRTILVEEARDPLCLAWRADSTSSVTRRGRGQASLWGKAIAQIPDGAMGIVYTCYEETASSVIADRRTDRVSADGKAWAHRWTVNVPLIVTNRLYPRPIGVGQPDIIESSMPGVAEFVPPGFENGFPLEIFVRSPGRTATD